MGLAEETPGWPSLSTYASIVYVPVALKLLGIDALVPNSTVVMQWGVDVTIPLLVFNTCAHICKAYVGRRSP